MSGRKKAGALPAMIAVAAAMACAGGEGAPAPDIDDAAIAETVLRLENEMNSAVPASDTSAGFRVLNSFGLARLSGPFETWHSHGHEQRARRIRRMVLGMLDFYCGRLGVSIDPYVLVSYRLQDQEAEEEDHEARFSA